MSSDIPSLVKGYKSYLVHAFLQHFAQTTGYAFGALLLYVKTQSVIMVLIYGLVQNLTSMGMKGLFISPYLKFVQKVGPVRVMAYSLSLTSLSLICLYYLQVSGPLTIAFLYAIGFIHTVANSSYWNIANAVKFNYVGSSETPGRFSSYYSTVVVLSTLTSALVGLLFHLAGNFIGLFLLSAAILLVSIIPIRNLSFSNVSIISFRQCLGKISKAAFFANFNPEHEFKTTAVPLIILFSLGSLSKSIWISVLVVLATILFVNVTGYLKDKGSSILVWLGLVIFMISWFFYGFANTEIQFIILGISLGLSSDIIGIAREARLSKEVAATSAPIESTVVVEFARAFGMATGYAILILTYVFFGYLWQPILVLGALFILPKGIYALKNINNN